MGLLLEEGLPGNLYREWIGYRDEGRWRGIACFSGDISLYAPDPSVIPPFAEYALVRMPMVPRIISRKETVDRFWEIFRRAPYPLLFDRHQLVYTLDPQDLPQQPATGSVRPARLDETVQVATLASAMSYEEIQMDPLKEHRYSYLRLVEERIEKQRYYVLEEGGEIKFQVHLNSITPYAGQITGVYTPPQHRGHGYGTRGMVEFCKLAFERAPRLCLFVNDFNRVAIRLYESLGFKACMDYRAIFLKEPGRV
jgi:hypothetical protein